MLKIMSLVPVALIACATMLPAYAQGVEHPKCGTVTFLNLSGQETGIQVWTPEGTSVLAMGLMGFGVGTNPTTLDFKYAGRGHNILFTACPAVFFGAGCSTPLVPTNICDYSKYNYATIINNPGGQDNRSVTVICSRKK